MKTVIILTCLLGAVMAANARESLLESILQGLEEKAGMQQDVQEMNQPVPDAWLLLIYMALILQLLGINFCVACTLYANLIHTAL